LAFEAIVATVCVAGLRWGDPGVIERDPWLPLPEEVTRCLASGEPLPTENVPDAALGSFCVRCLVWRPPPPAPVPPCCAADACELAHTHRHPDNEHASSSHSWLLAALPAAAAKACAEESAPAHHCSVCARCVRDFSHHCGFFGRCIAAGNRAYFRTVVRTGHVAAVTYGAVLAAYLAHSASASVATLPIALGLWLAYYCANGGGGLFLTLARFALQRRCPSLVALVDQDLPKLPDEPVLVAVLGPWCGLYVPVKC